jgi:ATP-dependent helicase/nuclease subunit A
LEPGILDNATEGTDRAVAPEAYVPSALLPTVEETEAVEEPADFLAPDTDEDPDTARQRRRKKAAESAARGTATHLFLQFCALDRAAATGCREELARLTEEGYLAKETGDLVRLNELDAFFGSDLFTRLRNARLLRRELRFSLFLPAAEFTDDPDRKERLQNETLLVQGVMDLLFEDADGNLVLCDYKTDRLRPAERRDPEAARRALWERHGRQLHYYALAVEQLFGRRPDAVLLYSTALGRAFDCVTEITP